MELSTYDSPSSPSFKYHQPTSTTHYNPLPYPDDLAKLQTLEPWSDTPPRWYNRITIPLPLLYGFHFLGVLVFGLVTLLLGLLGGGYRKNFTAFWDLCPEFITVTITLCVLVLVHQVFLPRFWRRRARELVQTGAFSPRGAHQDSKSGFAFSNIVQGGGDGGGKVVLEIGCNDGSTSAIFAREILSHQGDVANLSAPSAYLPTFVGYDRWSKWSRIPNGPEYFLSTLMRVGVPRDNIRAYSVDMTSKDTRTTLPFRDNTFDLIICNLGIAEIVGVKANKPKYKNKLFTEMTRVLKSGVGMMVVVEADATRFKQKGEGGKRESKGKWSEGVMGAYRRILVDALEWPESNVKVQSDHHRPYLIALKPVGANTSLPV